VAFRFNSFIGLALAERLAGAQGLLLIAVLIGVCVPLFNVGAVWPMARHAQRGFARELLRNPLIIATVSGLAGQPAGLSIPVWLEPTVTALARVAGAGPDGRRRGHAVGLLARSQDAGRGGAVHRHLLLPLVALGLRAAVWPGRRADHGAAGLLGPAHGVQLLRAGRAHGLQRRPMWPGWSRCPRCWACSRAACRLRAGRVPLRQQRARRSWHCPRATATLRSQRSWPMRRIGLPSVRRRNSASSRQTACTSCWPAQPLRSSKSARLRWANLFHGHTSWQSSQP
jgi:hypothetical protein